MFATFPHEPRNRRLALALLTWTWCLPNTLVSLGALLFARAMGGRAEPFRGAVVVRVPFMRRLGGVCLGPAILVSPEAPDHIVRHEWGHFRQHLRLGPLYYVVVGLPSVTHALWFKRRPVGNYFHFYTEAWADALGGVYAEHAHVHPRWTGYAWAPALLLALVAVTLRAWGHALAYPFTDTDALADVAVARHPLGWQLLAPLTGGYGGDNANFWRPAAMVQFWLQRRLFGWDPTGWHAWDLGLHVLASALLAGFVLATTRFVAPERPAGHQPGAPPRPGDRALAALVALLFAAHPLAEEVVPAVARNLDLLLGVATFGALWALAGAQARRRDGEAAGGLAALYVLGAAVAVGAKEAGVLLLPLAALWIVLFRTDLAPGPRAREAVRFAAPVAGVVAVYVTVRAQVLGGIGGYHAAEELAGGGMLGAALERAFVEPMLPSLSAWLEPLRGAPAQIGATLAWAGLLWLGRDRPRLLALAAGLYLPWVLILGLTGTWSRRVLYVPTAALCLVVAVVLLAAWRRRLWAAAVPLGLWLAAYAHGSPVVRRYADWGDSGAVGAVLTEPSLWADLPAGSTVWLVDRPARVDGDPRRYRLWSTRKSLNGAVASYAVQAWVDERFPGRGLRVRNLTSVLPEGPVADLGARVAVEGDAIVVERGRPLARRLLAEGAFRVEGDGPTTRIVAASPVEAPAWALVWDPLRATRVPMPRPR